MRFETTSELRAWFDDPSHRHRSQIRIVGWDDQGMPTVQEDHYRREGLTESFLGVVLGMTRTRSSGSLEPEASSDA